jgi:hypothetical protein
VIYDAYEVSEKKNYDDKFKVPEKMTGCDESERI